MVFDGTKLWVIFEKNKKKVEKIPFCDFSALPSSSHPLNYDKVSPSPPLV